MNLLYTTIRSPYRILFFLTLFFSSLTGLAQKTVTGTVKANDIPLSGATVTVKNTLVATSTNDAGNFSIEVPAGSSILVISYIDYETQEVNISSASRFDVSLVSTDNTLNVVVVTGYSSQRKRDITGAVTVVDVSKLKSQPSSDATAQLQGRASGVNVITTGVPGSSSQVRIRGLGSFNNNNPLYVVDGVQTFSINGLNPNDIESMQVLKDAASASVYGVRGSNGVIIITTKKAKRKGVNVGYNMYYGAQDPGKGVELLNAQEEAELFFLSLRNSGLPTTGTVYGNGATPVLPDYIYYTGAPNNGVPIMSGNPGVNPALYDLDYNQLGNSGYTPYIIVPANKQGTNWFNEVTRTAPIQNHNLSLIGAGDNSKVFFSVDYFNQEAITRYQFYKRYTVRLNTEYSFFNNAVRVGENIQAFYSSQNVPFNRNPNDVGAMDADNGRENSIIAQTFRPKSIIPAYTIREGDFAGTRGGSDPDNTWGNAKNPLAQLYRTRNDRSNNVNVFGNVYAELDLFRHFTARTSFGGSLNNQTNYRYPWIEYEHVENTVNITYNESFIRNDNWIWTNQLAYKQTFGDHDVNAVVGMEAQRAGGRQIIGAAQGFFTYSYQPYINLGNGGVQNLSDSRVYTPTKTVSYFGKADYGFRGKYLASLTVRRDGSSKFLSDYRWGTFPAFSLGWRISDEYFMKKIAWVTDLKLRGSWGKMGNEAAATAQNAFTTFGSTRNSSWYDIDGNQTSPLDGFTLTLLGNIFGRWEENKTTNIGFDASLFNNTLEIVFDWYQKKTDGLLYNPTVEGIRGSQRPSFQNVAGMKNNGIDLMVTHRFNLNKDIRFTNTLTFTTYNNKITSIAPGLTYFDFNSPANEANRIGGNATRNFVGQPLNTFFGYNVIGLFQSAADVTSSPAQPGAAPGRFKYEDVNGDKVIDANDRKVIGDPNPDFTYGFNLGVEYKNFDLQAFFYGVAGKDIFNTTRWWTDFSPGGFPGGRSKRALYESWLPDGSRPNATTPIQERSLVENGFSQSVAPNSYYVENGSFFRMRNLQIGFTIPESISSKAKISRARIYIQGTNLFTITKYTGMDPDIISVDDRSAGLDMGSYPTVRQFLIGANITF
jgi:TonB-linked SusC/RagA family outer membrane protein